MQGIIVLSNPHSGRNRRDKARLKAIEKIVGNNGIVRSTKNADGLEKILSDIHKEKPKAIVINGGDGTVASVVTTLVKYWPPETELPALGVIPSGTINILAKECASLSNKKKPSRMFLRPFNYMRNLFTQKDQLDYLRNIISVPEDKLFYRDVDFMKITDNNDSCIYGFSVGTGLVVSILNEYYKAKHLKLMKIASMCTRMIGSAIFNGKYYQSFNRKYLFSINDNEPEDYLAINAQTLQSIGMPKSTPFYKAQLSSGQFHALGTKFDLAKFMRYAAAFYAGDEVPESLDLQTDKLVLSSEQEFAYQVNGELEFMGKPLRSNILKIENGIRCKIVQPKNGF